MGPEASGYTQALMENLTYEYTAGTNKNLSISDGAMSAQGGFRAGLGQYTYDANGNMLTNGAKGITSISYNHLNLPTNITITGGKTIDFTYAADGTKLRKVVKTGATINLVMEYVNGVEYRGTAIPATTLEAVYFSEGRMYNISGTWKREYVIKDHLGNTRIAYCDINGDGVIAVPGEILQENNYDAFGYGLDGVYMNHANVDNLYQYNGKELNGDHGLGMYDYGARWYDPVIGRWGQIDQMAEKMAQCTPFNYVLNNPIRLNDPDGNAPEDIIITGSIQFKQQAFNNLQKLTNTPLVLLENGKVVQSNNALPFTTHATFIPLTTKGSEGSVETIAGTNLPKPKLNGTDLVIDLINSAKDITIQEATGGNLSTASSGEANIQSDGSNGRGSNATVEFNPSNPLGGVDINGGRNRPAQIGLGHELIHARHYASGTRNPSSSGILDPDGSGAILSNEERNTRMEENNLRREQGVFNRKIN